MGTVALVLPLELPALHLSSQQHVPATGCTPTFAGLQVSPAATVSLSARNPWAGCCRHGHTPEEGSQVGEAVNGVRANRGQTWDSNLGTDATAECCPCSKRHRPGFHLLSAQSSPVHVLLLLTRSPPWTAWQNFCPPSPAQVPPAALRLRQGLLRQALTQSSRNHWEARPAR